MKIMENPIKMDDLGVFPPLFLGNTHVLLLSMVRCDGRALVCAVHTSELANDLKGCS